MFIKKLATLDFSGLSKIQDDLQKAYKADDEAGKAILDRYDEWGTKAAEIAQGLRKVGDNQAVVKENVDDTKKSFDNLKPSIGRASSEAQTLYATLKKQAEEFGATQTSVVQRRISKELAAIDQVVRAGLAKEKEGFELRAALQAKYDKELREARLADIQKEVGDLQKIASQPIAFFLKFNDTDFNTLGLSKSIREAVSAGLGFLGNVLQGKEGAKKLLGGLAETLGQRFLGIPGMGALFEMLAQGPEQVRAMVAEFANAIPDIVVAVIDAIPVVIDTLAENLDEIIIKLVDKLSARAPDIALAIAKAVQITLPLAIIKAAVGFQAAIFQAVARFVSGAGEFVGKLVAGAGEFIGKLLEGAGQFVNELIAKVKDAIIPGSGGGGGLGGDLGRLIGTVGGALGPGGIPGAAIGGDIGQTIGNGIGQIGRGLGIGKTGGEFGGSNQSVVISIPVQIDKREIANVIIDLKRYGYRLEPA